MQPAQASAAACLSSLGVGGRSGWFGAVLVGSAPVHGTRWDWPCSTSRIMCSIAWFLVYLHRAGDARAGGECACPAVPRPSGSGCCCSLAPVSLRCLLVGSAVSLADVGCAGLPSRASRRLADVCGVVMVGRCCCPVGAWRLYEGGLCRAGLLRSGGGVVSRRCWLLRWRCCGFCQSSLRSKSWSPSGCPGPELAVHLSLSLSLACLLARRFSLSLSLACFRAIRAKARRRASPPKGALSVRRAAPKVGVKQHGPSPATSLTPLQHLSPPLNPNRSESCATAHCLFLPSFRHCTVSALLRGELQAVLAPSLSRACISDKEGCNPSPLFSFFLLGMGVESRPSGAWPRPNPSLLSLSLSLSLSLCLSFARARAAGWGLLPHLLACTQPGAG